MANITKLTPWFTDGQKPVRPGVYQQRSAHYRVLGYRRWDGWRWYLWRPTSQEASEITTVAALGHQYHPWRGLADPPTGTDISAHVHPPGDNQ